MFISELQVGPLNTVYVLLSLLAEISQKWQFSAEIKKRRRKGGSIDRTDGKFNSQNEVWM